MAKLAAFGTLLKKGATTIANVKTIGGPSLSTDTIDVTTHDSPNATREFVAGLLDAGEVQFDADFDPAGATHAALLADWQARTVNAYSLTFPGGGSNDVCSFNALVTKVSVNAPVDGDLTIACTLKISGLPTWA